MTNRQAKNIGLCQSLAFNVCNLPTRDRQQSSGVSFYSQVPKVHSELHTKLCFALCPKSGHTESNAPAYAYHIRPPKLIRKLRCLREAKMEFLFNPLCLSLK